MFANARLKGIALIFLATFIWSGNPVIGRMIVGEIPPLTFNFLRWFAAGLVLCAFALPRLKQEWPAVKKFLPTIIPCGIISVAMFNALWYMAAQTTTAVNIALIGVTTPLFIIIFSMFKGKKPSMNQILGCIVAFSGSIYLVTDGKLENFVNMQFAIGDMFVLISAIAFAIYSMMLSNTPKGISQTSILSIMILSGLCVSLPVVCWELSLETTTPITLNTMFFCSVIYAGIFNSLIAWGVWNLGLVYAGAVVSGVIYYTMPVMSGILGLLILGEAISTVTIISGALIIGGVMWCLVPSKKRA